MLQKMFIVTNIGRIRIGPPESIVVGAVTGQCLFFGFPESSNFLGSKNKMMILVGFAVF